MYYLPIINIPAPPLSKLPSCAHDFYHIKIYIYIFITFVCEEHFFLHGVKTTKLDLGYKKYYSGTSSSQIAEELMLASKSAKKMAK